MTKTKMRGSNVLRYRRWKKKILGKKSLYKHLSYYWGRPFYILADLPDQIKWFSQRVFRGYDDVAMWSLRSYFVRKFRKPLKAFVKNYVKYGVGCPGCLTQKDGKSIPVEQASKEWIRILRKIEKAFDLMWEEEEATDQWNKKTTKRRIADGDLMQEGFELFGKYFLCLWD